MSEENGELVFVYGPLRRGGSEAYRMKGAEFVATGRVAGSLYHLPEGPGLVLEGASSPTVRGELYRMSADKLRRLDEFDGLNSEERESSNRCRRHVLVHSISNDGETCEAWAWVWLGQVDPRQWIRSGDWLVEIRPNLSERLRRYPWFTLIGLICLLAFPAGMAIGSVLRYPVKSPVPQLVRPVVLVLASLSPFAAVFSLWLASRRRETDMMFGFLLVLAIAACGLVILGLFMWLVQTIS